MSKNKAKKRGGIFSAKGQRFFNFAYSIGAAIVIWGALFKILHLPGGNTLLSIGMGTEVLMFVLTAFDRPPREYAWENVFPQLDKDKEAEEEAEPDLPDAETIVAEVGTDADTDVSAMPASTGQTIIVSGGDGKFAASGIPAAQAENAPATPSDVTMDYTAQVASLADEMRRLHESTAALNTVSETLLASYKAITDNSADITRTSSGYVEQLSDLNRNIQGLNTIYEIQLKSISSQLDSIERVNRGIKDIRDMYEKSAEQSARYCEETEKMARYMQQLNKVYEKMIHAMTVNPMMASGLARDTAAEGQGNA